MCAGVAAPQVVWHQASHDRFRSFSIGLPYLMNSQETAAKRRAKSETSRLGLGGSCNFTDNRASYGALLRPSTIFKGLACGGLL